MVTTSCCWKRMEVFFASFSKQLLVISLSGLGSDARNGENPTSSYKWTSWGWEISGWSPGLEEKYWRFVESCGIWPKSIKKNEKIKTCTSWTWKRLGFFNQLCPKISLVTGLSILWFVFCQHVNGWRVWILCSDWCKPLRLRLIVIPPLLRDMIVL